MREALAFVFLACACGAATWKGRADDARRSSAGDGSGPARAEASGPAGGPSWRGGVERQFVAFASLEGRGTVLAPGMRRAAERENGGERVELVRAAGRDACVRVAFEATTPVTARLLDADAGVLAETRTAATEGALGAQGPVCIRKGDAVSAVAEGAGARVRWVAWASP